MVADSERRLDAIREVVYPVTDKIFWFATFESIRRTESSLPSGGGRRAKNRSHSFEKSHEILLPMRADDGGRAALLQFLRTELMT